ncbi:glycoside hydrolase family 16 protein [Mucilaginibacter sp.]|uniref:glycoside hydrolase family 16 protein n=1 Tax=Mucilaginibacter sp. TaxID=1882438 RepID=UPI0026356D95|nr:glycoside hydrolase family 16 protein [Mucilaginibacter sp.]MDB4926371.1 glycoside hydrolase family 16 protein [Mucilaginibacter sp.]
MKLLNLLFLLLGISQTSFAQQKPDTLFFENFNGTTLNRDKWNVEVTGRTVNNEQQAYVDSATILKVSNGMLAIKPVYHPGYTSNMQKQYDFLSGRVNTRNKFAFTYGTASAKIKMTAGAGLWPAFWALGEGKWPDCGEIDIMENIGDSLWVNHALHGPGYFGNTPLVYHSFFPKGTDITQWHIYSVSWAPDKLVFSIDGAATYTVTKEMVEKYGRWAYDDPKYIILNFALGGGFPNGVNKITTPYFGMPQNTVDKIKAGKADFVIDWVLVTKK